jgi:hypothetical protein
MARYGFDQGHHILVASQPFPDPLAGLVEREASSIRESSIGMHGHDVATDDVRREAGAMFSAFELHLHVGSRP